MSGKIGFTMDFGVRQSERKISDNSGFRIYVIGDFSGRSESTWQQRKIRKIDTDNFDQVMTEILPTLEIGSGSTLQFETLDAFQPDVWLEKIQISADLLRLKSELSNPATAGQAAAKIQAYFQPETTIDTSSQSTVASESQEELLERLLGKKPEKISDKAAIADRLISQIISPLVKQDADPQSSVLLELVDTTLSQFLRTVLHRPDFQQLEALWVATAGLVNEEFADEQSFFLVDISRAELLAELVQGGSVFEQKLRQHAQMGDGEQDVLLLGDVCFSGSGEDRDLLLFFNRLATTCEGRFLGGADHSLFQSENIQNWTQFCHEHGSRVLLAYPRYLLRLPYGKKRDPIEAFDFEECPAIPQADDLLWGNPAFLSTRLLIKTIHGQQAAEQFYFSEIPAFTFDQDGERLLQPGTETVLNETQANALLAQGIAPLIGFRQRQGVRLLIP